MTSFQAIMLMLLSLNLSFTTDEERSSVLKFVVNLLGDVCQDRDGCVDNVLDDLIFLISGDPYDPLDRDTGSSRMTVLLEVIDEKCELDKECLENLFAEMRNRIISQIDEFTAEISDSSIIQMSKNNNTGIKNKLKEAWAANNDEKFFQNELLDGLNDDGLLGLKYDEPDGDVENNDQVDENSEETPFERFELNDNLDETILNTLIKDECQQNREDCAKFVAKQKKLGLNHIGKISLDEDGDPVAEVPKSVIFEAELNIPDGSDGPE